MKIHDNGHDDNEIQTTIVQEVIRARKEKGLTQVELAKISGVKQPVIARLESGATDPQVSTVLRLLVPLGKRLAVVSI